MKSKTPFVLAAGLVLVWALFLGAMPLILDVFKNFKVEIPAVTMTWLSLSGLAGSLGLPALVLATAILLALRQQVGWGLALALVVVGDLAALGLALPFVALRNTLSAVGALTLPSPSSFSWLLTIVVGAFVLNQILFVMLLVKRREFSPAPPFNESLLPLR